MAKVLRCGDVIAGCTRRIVGMTEQDIMARQAAHAQRSHGMTELPPELQQRIAQHITDRQPGEAGDGAWAHVNVWRLSAADESENATTARAVGERLRRQPGFRLYALVRTAEREVVAVTVFASEDELASALDQVTDVVGERVRPLAGEAPERRAGPVLHLLLGGVEA
jgi:predicted small metal-binding protein